MKKLSHLRLIDIIDKNGKHTKVWIDPGKYLVQEGKLVVREKLRGLNEKKRVTNKGKVIDVEEEKMKRISNYPLSWNLMHEGKWKKTTKEIDGEKVTEYRAVLTESQWKELLKENGGQLYKITKAYNKGRGFGDAFQELLAIAKAGYIEGINKYGKIKEEGGTKDISAVAASYAIGRVKEAVANQMSTGIRIPSELQTPYNQFKKVFNFVRTKTGRNPREHELIEHLAKLWTKKTFYPQYLAAEDRKYGMMKVKNYFKTGFVKQRVKRFEDLTPAEQNRERKKDKLPIEGYVSINKQGVAIKKDDKHAFNIKAIQDEGRRLIRQLQYRYKKSNTRTPQQIADEQLIMQTLEKRVVDTKKKMVDAFEARSKKITENKKEVEELDSKLYDIDLKIQDKTQLFREESAKKVPKAKTEQKKSVLRHLRKELQKLQDERKPFSDKRNEIGGEIGKEKYIQAEQDNFYTAKTEWENAEKDLDLAKKSLRRMDENDIEKEKEKINALMQSKLHDESRRYSGDVSSSTLLGVRQRVREMTQIHSAKDMPLNIDFKDDEDSGRSAVEIIHNKEQMDPHEIIELKDTHDAAKKIFIAHINSELKPVYGEVAKLQLGLHEKSKPTPDRLWGELASNKEIVQHFENKSKVWLENPQALAKKMKSLDIISRDKIAGALPFVADQYRDGINKYIVDYSKWERSKPKHGSVKKIKIANNVYRKKRREWLKRKRVARKIWKIWRRKNKHLEQKDSVKKFMEIKKKLKATKVFKPNRFVKVNLRPTTKVIKLWNKRQPKLFIDSSSGREKWVANTLDTANAVLRRTIPTSVIRDLQMTHNKLVNSA